MSTDYEDEALRSELIEAFNRQAKILAPDAIRSKRSPYFFALPIGTTAELTVDCSGANRIAKVTMQYHNKDRDRPTERVIGKHDAEKNLVVIGAGEPKSVDDAAAEVIRDFLSHS